MNNAKVISHRFLLEHEMTSSNKTCLWNSPDISIEFWSRRMIKGLKSLQERERERENTREINKKSLTRLILLVFYLIDNTLSVFIGTSECLFSVYSFFSCQTWFPDFLPRKRATYESWYYKDWPKMDLFLSLGIKDTFLKAQINV